MTGPQSLMWMATFILTGLAPVGETSILSIAGGNVVQEGSNVTISCSCRGHGPHIACADYPTFEINHSLHSGVDIADGRYPGYSIMYYWLYRVHKLTAHNVLRSQNGTTYKCGLKDGEGNVDLWSNTVTMIVTSGHSEYSVADSTRQQTSTTVNIVNTHSSNGVAGDIQMLTTSLIATPLSPSHITNITSSSYHQTPSTTSTPQAPATIEPEHKPTLETIPKSDKEDDAPTYVYVAVGSGVGIVVYILTIVLIGLVISLKIKGKKAAERRSRRRTPSPEQQGANRYPISIPMVSNPVYSEVVSPSGPAPPYFTVDPCQFGDRQIVVRMDNKYHDVPQRKSVAAESLYDYIDMQ